MGSACAAAAMAGVLVLRQRLNYIKSISMTSKEEIRPKIKLKPEFV